MKAFWDERYRAPDYAYGTEPNVYFSTALASLAPGRLLLPAEGEGRNAVHAAQAGWEVTAFDLSDAGRDKALALARERAVALTYEVGSVETILFPERHFDALGLIYAHFPAEIARASYQKLLTYLRPGGRVILEGFRREQLGLPSGGPKNDAMLFSRERLANYLAGLSELDIVEADVELAEGAHHVGPARVIRALGKK